MEDKIISGKICAELNLLTQQYFSDNFIDHVNIITKYRNGTLSYVCNNEQWLRLYVSKKYPLAGFFENNTLPETISYMLWDNLDPLDPILVDSKNVLNLLHGVTFVKHSDDASTYFNLGQKNSQRPILFEYIKNQQRILRFIDYFMDSSINIQKHTERNRLYCCHGDIEIMKNGDFTNQSLRGKSHYLLSEYNIQLPESVKMFYQRIVGMLSIRQLDVLYLVLSGFTMKMIGIRMNISLETVKTHIKQIRAELDYHCTPSMIEDCFNHKVRYQLQHSKALATKFLL
ncbi:MULTISPECIES: response regulator transcription factor [Cysteiniphilum]|uniref:response regulator transcription factor n=1 Tax=Cysteiniphilum TaxID=2056696 RepID=UPI00177FC5FD|nr:MULTISPECIES: helix-turn-helix transcriptional regulator [Cysteiniphilum]